MPRTAAPPRRNDRRGGQPPQQLGDGGSKTQSEAEEDNLKRLVGMVAAKREQLTMLLAGQVDPERFITVALQAVQSQPALLRCSPLSILSAIRDAATYGLEPTGILGDAAIVPYENQATLQIEYRGIRKLAMRDGSVAVVTADVVYDNDHFRLVSGSDPKVEHEPTLDVERGNVKGAYAWSRATNGELLHTWMPLADLIKRRATSKSWRKAERDGSNNSVWHLWADEMMKKTVLKRHCSEKLPLTPVARKALAADTEADLERPGTSRAVTVSGSDARNRLLSRMGIGEGSDLSEGDTRRIAAAEAGPQDGGDPRGSASDAAGTDPAPAGDGGPADHEGAGDRASGDGGAVQGTPAPSPDKPGHPAPGEAADASAAASPPDASAGTPTSTGEVEPAGTGADAAPSPVIDGQATGLKAGELRDWLREHMIGISEANTVIRERFGDAATLDKITDAQRAEVRDILAQGQAGEQA